MLGVKKYNRRENVVRTRKQMKNIEYMIRCRNRSTLNTQNRKSMKLSIIITEYRNRTTRVRPQTRCWNVFIKKIRKYTDLIRASKRSEVNSKRGVYPKLCAQQSVAVINLRKYYYFQSCNKLCRYKYTYK